MLSTFDGKMVNVVENAECFISTRIPISTIYIQQCKQKLQTNCNLDRIFKM